MVNQSALSDVLPEAMRAGMGVVAKRPIANARMLSPDAPYWQPVRALLGEEGLGEDPLEWALRFTLSHSSIHSAIVGTTNSNHVRENALRAARGSLPKRALGALYDLSGRKAG